MIMLRLKNVHVIRGCIIPQKKEYHHEQTWTKKNLEITERQFIFFNSAINLPIPCIDRHMLCIIIPISSISKCIWDGILHHVKMFYRAKIICNTEICLEYILLSFQFIITSAQSYSKKKINTNIPMFLVDMKLCLMHRPLLLD